MAACRRQRLVGAVTPGTCPRTNWSGCSNQRRPRNHEDKTNTTDESIRNLRLVARRMGRGRRWPDQRRGLPQQTRGLRRRPPSRQTVRDRKGDREAGDITHQEQVHAQHVLDREECNRWQMVRVESPSNGGVRSRRPHLRGTLRQRPDAVRQTRPKESPDRPRCAHGCVSFRQVGELSHWQDDEKRRCLRERLHRSEK